MESKAHFQSNGDPVAQAKGAQLPTPIPVPTLSRRCLCFSVLPDCSAAVGRLPTLPLSSLPAISTRSQGAHSCLALPVMGEGCPQPPVFVLMFIS